ncbi:putative ABC transporter permease [Clostridium sp. CS001]|uniref:putative ABC transporter permease n=1 Tax=Clostridium sp. CS001 TaxID=2880648 RepID=UPI001CF19032|nr:putative ABC transporter permease [Clostridium sp. CS001]MCB2291255.1 putative ABC transporter permease [Clostridium sp. CS001]
MASNIYLISPRVVTLFYYFIIYSFMGWCIETVYATINKREFVNRGFLHGPFCPIYGFGTLSIIVLLKSIESNYVFLFLGSVLLTSTIEYVTGLILENLFNSTWWDYSDKPYNLHGRICLSFSIIWGFISIFILKIVHPYVVYTVNLIPTRPSIIILCAIFMYLFIDFTVTVITVLKLRTLLTQINNVHLELTDKLSGFKFNIANYRDISELRVKLDQLIEGAEMKVTKKKSDVEHIVKELKIKYDLLIIKRSPNYLRLINAFPSLKFKGLDSILKDVKTKVHNAKKK